MEIWVKQRLFDGSLTPFLIPTREERRGCHDPWELGREALGPTCVLSFPTGRGGPASGSQAARSLTPASSREYLRLLFSVSPLEKPSKTNAELSWRPERRSHLSGYK